MLSFAVVVIWGIIGYKLFSILSDDSDNVALNYGDAANSKVESPVSDTFSLVSHGSDPFFRQMSIGQKVPDANKSAGVSKEEKLKVYRLIWPSVQYKGVVSRSGGQKQSVMVVINGVNYILQKGEVVNGLEMVFVSADSIKMRYSSETKYIVRGGK